jgi:cytoskeletal protein CcmA (bactofilin family)
MKKQGNFSKAIEELLSGKIGDEGSQAVDQIDAESVGIEEESAPREGMVQRGNSISFTSKPQAKSLSGGAVITADMVIKGSVSSTATIRIDGTILGDVSSEGDLLLHGKVEGNIKVHSLTVDGGTVTGDVESEGSILVTENSSVSGNIRGGHIEINGKIVGNIDSSGKLILNPKAVIEGDISSLGLSMSEGAELKGKVNVHGSVTKLVKTYEGN